MQIRESLETGVRPLLARRFSFWAIASIGAVIFAACTFTADYVSRQQLFNPLGYWDGYFDKYASFGADIASAHLSGVVNAVRGIRHDDYNVSSLLLLIPNYLIFGDSRIVYTVSLVILYLLPACLLATRIAHLAALAPNESADDDGTKPAWVLAAALLFWPFWEPTIRGLPDVLALIPLSCLSLMALFLPRFREKPILAGSIMGLLLWSCFLVRRHFAYACVAFLFCTFVCLAVWLIRNRSEAAGYIRPLIKGALASGISAVAALVIFQLPFAIHALTTPYAEINASWQKSWAEQVSIQYGRVGPLIAGGVVLGLIRAVAERRGRILYFAAMAAITLIALSRIQLPGIQHMLPIALWLFPAFVYGMSWPFGLVRQKQFIWILPALILVSFASVFSAAAHQRLSWLSAALPSETYPPPQLPQKRTYLALVEDVRRLDPSAQVAVFGGSQYFAPWLFALLDKDLAARIAWTSTIDLQHGISLAPLRADLAIVTDRPAIDFPPQTQRTVSIPNGMILNGEGFGAGYNKVLGPYPLADGYKAYVYRRTRPISDAETADIIARFRAFYPNWRLEGDKFGPPA